MKQALTSLQVVGLILMRVCRKCQVWLQCIGLLKKCSQLVLLYGCVWGSYANSGEPSNNTKKVTRALMIMGVIDPSYCLLHANSMFTTIDNQELVVRKSITEEDVHRYLLSLASLSDLDRGHYAFIVNDNGKRKMYFGTSEEGFWLPKKASEPLVFCKITQEERDRAEDRLAETLLRGADLMSSRQSHSSSAKPVVYLQGRTGGIRAYPRYLIKRPPLPTSLLSFGRYFE